jgi:alkylhydroperoxidase family enzyme
LFAPIDDEPFTDEERAAVEAAEAAYRRGEWVSDEDVRREFGW